MAFYKVPVNLPHAATIVRRIEHRLSGSAASLDDDERSDELWRLAQMLSNQLGRYEGGQDPGESEAAAVIEGAASTGRLLVDEIEKLEIGEDRLGQLIRNLFECLGLGEEGAEISLRAGENPNSLMRPL